MKERVHVQIIGSYLDQIQNPLLHAGIVIEDLLRNGNPLGFFPLTADAAVSAGAHSVPSELLTIDNKVTQLTLKKNLKAYLSHDAASFCDNVVKNRFGKTVRYQNSASWLIVSNTSLTYPLFDFHGQFFSDTYPKNDLSKFLRDTKARELTKHLEFNDIKQYYQKYIEILLSEFDSQHIILVESAPSSWYCNRLETGMMDPGFSTKCRLLREADSYFQQQTGCFVASTLEAYVPDKQEKRMLPNVVFSPCAYEKLAEEIIQIISQKNPEDGEERSVPAAAYSGETLKLYNMLSPAGRKHFQVELDTAWKMSPCRTKETSQQAASHPPERKRTKASGKWGFFSRLSYLGRAVKSKVAEASRNIKISVAAKNGGRSSEKHLNRKYLERIRESLPAPFCAFAAFLLEIAAAGGFSQYLIHAHIRNQKEFSEDILRSMQLFAAYGHVESDDMLSLYAARQLIPPHQLAEIASALLENTCCTTLEGAWKRYEQNVAFLGSYPYIAPAMITSGLQGQKTRDRCYIRLNEQSVMTVSRLEGEEPFQLIDTGYVSQTDENRALETFRCGIMGAEALCSNLKFYIERAKKGLARHPFMLEYGDQDSFFRSLFLIDYPRLLGSEPFLIGYTEQDFAEIEPRTNLEFLFHDKARIVKIGGGLSDQITYYFLSKCIENEGYEVYYDDLQPRSVKGAHVGYELDKVLVNDIRENCLSVILSPALLKNFDGHEKEVADIFSQNGLTQLVAVDAGHLTFDFFKNCSRMLYIISRSDDYANLDPLIHGFALNVVYYHSFIRPEPLMLRYGLDIRQCFQFPAYEDEKNIRLKEEMQHCVPVGIHVRRGDYTDFEGETNTSFYTGCIRKILQIEDYKAQLHFFVFSDDIRWCKRNCDSLGLTMDKTIPITYISHNKGDNSFRDMQLLSECKVIIGQQGGFARMAFLLSRQCEIYLLPDREVLQMLKRIGRGNRNDIMP